MNNLRNNIYVLGIGSGIISVILFYIEQTFIKKKDKVEMVDYIKIFVLVTGLVTGALIISKKQNIIESVSEETPKLIEQSIHTGEPNF